MENRWSVVLAILLVLVLFVFIDIVEPAYGFVGKVPTGHVGIITRFGEVKDDAVSEGRHFKPFFNKITNMSVQVQKMGCSLSAFSKDIQQVDTQIVVNYQVDGGTASKLFKTVGTKYDDIIINPAVVESVKAVFAQYTAENLINCRNELSAKVISQLNENLVEYGIIIKDVSIVDIDFTDAFTDAVEAKQVATQTKLQAQTEQEKLTIEAEAEAKRQVIEAQANAEVVKAKADAEAYAIREKAAAEAEGNIAIARSITEGLIDYQYAQNWDGKLPSTMLGENDGIIPVLGKMN